MKFARNKNQQQSEKKEKEEENKCFPSLLIR